ncbi:MAG: hypothetical protein GY822_15100 [Deltaproteobacteria bacterium]|nr:hypothetical protein [Deltaproteobacteria bacterium]
MAEIKFNNPQTIGITELGVTQTNKLLPFKTLNGVFIENPTVTILLCNNIYRIYTLGDGLELSGANEIGVEKTLTLTLNGSDFAENKNNVLDGHCSFFVEGDVEIVFKLKLL